MKIKIFFILLLSYKFNFADDLLISLDTAIRTRNAQKTAEIIIKFATEYKKNEEKISLNLRLNQAFWEQVKQHIISIAGQYKYVINFIYEPSK